MVPLPLSCGHVIDNGVAPNMVHCVLLADLKSGLPNNDTNLALIIRALREAGVGKYFITICDD